MASCELISVTVQTEPAGRALKVLDAPLASGNVVVASGVLVDTPLKKTHFAVMVGGVYAIAVPPASTAPPVSTVLVIVKSVLSYSFVTVACWIAGRVLSNAGCGLSISVGGDATGWMVCAASATSGELVMVFTVWP